MDSRKTSTLPRWREGKTRPATRISGTNGCMPDGAMRRGTCKRTHASAIRAVERLAKALSNNLLAIDVYSSMLAIKVGCSQRIRKRKATMLHRERMGECPSSKLIGSATATWENQYRLDSC